MNLEGYPTTWSKTRTYYLNTHAVWAANTNFGLGNEAAFTCPGCHRTLPRHIVTVDHVVSRAQMSNAVGTYVNTGAGAPGGLDWSQYTIRGANSTAIAKGTAQEQSDAISFIHKNSEFDLDNLTVMCSLCNTRKNSV